MASQDARLSKFEADFKQQQSEMTNKIDTLLKAINDRMTGAFPSDTVKNPKLNVNSTSSVSSTRSYPIEDPQSSSHMKKDPTCPLLVRSGFLATQLEPKEDLGGISKVSNFTGRIKGMHIFVGNFTYISDFMIVENISSIIDPRLSQVVLGKPFVEISNMTRDLSLGVVKFTGGTNEISYKMPHKIEKYNSLSNLEKEHTKSVYLRNKEDKRRGVEYVMNKILGFYKECLELGPEYLTGLEDEDRVT
ncbi:hypothetical protein Tco_0825332 [Tanacetum coccineum]